MPFYNTKVYAEAAIPTIVYVHSGGFEQAFSGDTNIALEYAERKLTRITDAILDRRLSPERPEYAILTIWGDVRNRNSPTIDAFVFGGTDNWPGNPEFAAGVFTAKGKLSRPKSRVVGCGDSLIMLGLEQEQRRRTRNINQYLGKKSRERVKDELRSKLLYMSKDGESR